MASPRTAIDVEAAQFNPLRAVLWLALPVLAEQLFTMLVGFSDTLLVGRYLSLDHLAAVNLMVYATWLLNSLFVSVAVGATALVARFIGAGDRRAAVRTTNQAMTLGLLCVAPLTAFAYAIGPPFVRIMHLAPEPAALAVQYLQIVVLSLPAVMIMSVGVACLRGAGDTISGLVIMTIVNVVNVALSWSLVHGFGPIPRWGWTGVATGTAIAYGVGGLLMLALLVRGRAGLQLRLYRMRPDWSMIGRVLRIGLPAGGDILTIQGCQFWFLSLIYRLGSLAAASHGVAIRIESLAYLPGIAFQVAASTLTGQALGAGDHARARRSVRTACIVGLALLCTCGVVFFAAAAPLARLFVGERQEDVVQTAAPLLRIVAFAMPALALQMILSGALRGAGDTRWPLLFSVIGFLLVRIPLTYVLTEYWSLGIRGAWYAMAIDLFLRCALVAYRFLHGGWARVRV